jgi:serine/threonine protein kinase
MPAHESERGDAAGSLTDQGLSRAFAMLRDSDDLLIPEDAQTPLLPGYTIDVRLGGGGGGEVFRAFRLGSESAVAVKFLRRAPANPALMQRAWRELDLLGQLRLPCVPRVLDYGVHDDRLFIVTEHIDGEPLDRHCTACDLGRRDCVELLARTADAIHSLHEHGVIHRDIKPSNILIDAHGQTWIIDLGIAALLASDVMDTLTMDGEPIGSPAFMSPEQARGETARISTRSDVYSLGATMFLVLAGSTPHDMETTIHEAIRRVAQDQPRLALHLDASLPKPLAAIMDKAVSARPENRYHSAAALAADLRRWLNAEPVEAGKRSIFQRIGRNIARHPVIATTCACMAIGVLTLAGTMLGVWWLNAQPVNVIVDREDKSVARLVSHSGHILHYWDTGLSGGIAFADILERHASAGGDQIILIAFGGHTDRALAGRLCAYDFNEPSRLLWSIGTRAPDIDMPAPISDVKGTDLRIEHVLLTEVFDESPGREIVAIHRHTGYSPCAIRVYDATGTALYEVWHDGVLESMHWLPGARLLACAGYNGERGWLDRGVSGLTGMPRPVVVFAVRPSLGDVRHEWLNTAGGAGTVKPEWYRCLLPPEAVDRLCGPSRMDSLWVEVRAVESDPTSRDHVQFVVQASQKRGCLGFTLDANGNEIIADRMVSDAYKHNRDRGLPDPMVFQLGDLPPLRPAEGESRQP